MGKVESKGGWTPPAADKEDSVWTPPATDIDGGEKKNSQNSLENNTGKSSGSNLQSGTSTSESENSTSDGFQNGNYKLPEGFDKLDIRALTNQPEEVVKENQRKQMQERFKPEAVKKADAKLKEVDNLIVNTSRDWNQIKDAQKKNIETLTNLKDQINDPMIAPDQKQQLVDIYQQTYNSALTTQESEKKVKEKAIKLQMAKSTLNKVYEVQQKLDMDENDDFLKATGNFLSHVYNALPETISGVGDIVESFGDVLKHPFSMPGVPGNYAQDYADMKDDEKNDKITDVIGKAIQNLGSDMKADTDPKYDDKHYISSTVGDIVGSIAVAAIPGSIAAKAGKTAQIITGATAATMQSADQIHTKAKELGLSDQDAGLMTLTVAPIQGLLEVWGASNVIDNIAGKKIIKELIDESTKKLVGQKVTKEVMFDVVSSTFKDVAKKYGLNAGKSALEEGAEEGVQQAVQDAAENIYDKSQGKDVYGTKFFSKETLLDVAQNAAIGAAAGSAFATISGISSNKSLYDKAVELKADPDKLAQFQDMLDTEVKAGHIEVEKADEIKANINAMMAADEKIPSSIKDKAKRLKAIELIKEKTALEEEIKGKDKAISTPQRERIKVLDSELEAIATGKEPVKMERRELGKTEKPAVAASAVEKTTNNNVKSEPVKLTDTEKSELKELERDNNRIGLEGDDLKRYQDLKSRIIPDVQAEIKFDGKQTKEEFISEQKAKLKDEEEFDETLDKDGVYDRIFGNKYEMGQIREERTQEMQQNEENDVKPIKEEEYEQLATELDQQPADELGELHSRANVINSEAESAEQSIGAAKNEGKALPEAEIERLEKEQTELLKDIDHVLSTPQRNKKKASRITKLLSEKPSTIREAALHYFLGGGTVRKADSERILGSNFKKADWGKNNALFDAKAPSIDKVAKEHISELLGRELTPDEETQAMEELADITLNKSNKNSQFEEAKTYREQKSKETERQEMNAHLSSETATDQTPDIEEKAKLNDEKEVETYEGDLPFQKVIDSKKYNSAQKRVAKSVTNVVKALSKVAPGLKVVLHDTQSSFENAAYEANKKLGLSENKARKDLDGRGFYFGKDDHVIHVNLPKVKSNTLFHEGVHPILEMVEDQRAGTIDELFTQLKGIEKSIGQEGKYTEDFAGMYGEEIRKKEAVTEFIADVAAGKVKVEEGNFSKIKRFFAKILKFFGINAKAITAENIVSLAKKIQTGFEKGEAIDLETNRALRDIVYGRYQQKTLAAIELEKQIEKAEGEAKAAKSAFDKKRKELDTSIVNDQEDLFGERKSAATEGGGLFDERVDVTQRDKVMEPFKVRLEKANDNLTKLKAKLKDEEGKSDLLLFQKTIEWKDILNKKLSPEGLLSLRRSISQKFPDSELNDILKEVYKPSKELYEDDRMAYYVDEGITLRNILSILYDEGNIDSIEDGKRYFESIGGLSTPGLFREINGLQFQKPENTDNIPEEDILWGLKTFKKLGNNYELFREKLSKTEEGRELLSKNLFGAMLEYNSEKPMASKADRLKSLSNTLHKAEYISEDLKEKIDENGLRSDIFSHEEARSIADIAIKALGVDGAVDLAKDRLQGSVKAFVYGAAVDYYAQKEAAATNTFEKDTYAQKGADIAEDFQKDAENYGRFISAIGDYYKNTPLIIQKTETNKLRTKAKEALAKMKRSVNKVKSVKKEFEDNVAEEVPVAKEKTPRKTIGDAAKRAAKRNELLEKWKSLSNAGGILKQVAGYSQEQTDVMVEMGAIHVADGAWTFDSWYKKMKADLGISQKAAREVWETEKMPVELDEAQRTLSQMITEDLGDTDEYKKQQEKVLNKYFPKKNTEKAKRKQKEDHEKIIEQYNAGIFDGGKNMDGEDFQKLFFDQLGIVNPDAPEVQAQLGEFAKKIHAAPDENSVFAREAQEDMLTYIANLAYRTRLESGASKLSSIWYANILSSPGTHLRNFQYNIITSAISQPTLLLEKAILKGDFKAAGTHMKGFMEGVKKGLVEGGRIMKTGRGSRFDRVAAKSELERGKYIKPFVVPGRGLKASDILFTDAAYNLKLSDLARQLVMKEHPEYTNEQINSSVNELLGNTSERKAAAKEQAENEMSEFYGADWQTQKGTSAVFKIRQFEIMEKSTPADLKEEALKWSKKSLLTSRPTGVLGVVADGINHWNEKLYFTKFIIPFVNVPFNLVNAIIDRSPIGLITAIRKAEGFRDFKEQLSDDEVRELYIKIANYAVATTTLALMNGDKDDDPLVITGAQTGDYQDNKGVIRAGSLEPYSVYMFGKKILSYKTTPWAAALLVPGYMRDVKIYGKDQDATDVAAYSAMNWLLFINDQSAMQGVQGLVSTVAESKKMNAEMVYTTVAKYMQNMVVPYSGALKFMNNNIKAMMGDEDNRPIDPIEYLTKDVPFLDQLARTRMDHFGQPVKETFDVPLLPIGQRGIYEAMSDKSPYYKLCIDKKYFPSFSTKRKMFVDGVEVNISKKELDDINTARGRLVKQALDSQNVFVPKDEASADETLSEMSTMDYLKTLDNDEFKKRMDDLFAEAEKLARIRKYGEKVGITPKDVDKALRSIDEFGESEQPKENANRKLEEEYQENGNIRIAVDAY